MQPSGHNRESPGRVGLALGSGSARGWSHLGVVRALTETGIRVYCVAGTHIGMLVRAVTTSAAIKEVSPQFIWAAIALSLLSARHALAEPSESSSGSGLGYLAAPSSSPGHILRPSSIFLQPGNIRRSSFEVSLDVNWANVWCYEPGLYLLDGEWIRLGTRIQYGLTDSFSMGVVLPVIGRTGGFADSTIEDFHETFHLGNASREQFPQNQSESWAKADDGTIRSIASGDSWGLGDILFFAVMKRPDLWAAPTVVIQGSLPTGDENELEGLGAPSLGLSTVATKRIGRSSANVFAGIGVVYCPEEELADIEINSLVYSGLFGLEYRVSPDLSLVVQTLRSSPVAKDFGAFSDPVYELSTGFKWQVRDAMIVEFAIVENLFNFSVIP